VKEVHCTRADALGMVTIDLAGCRGSLPTRGRTRLSRDDLVSHHCSMATQLGRLCHCERRPLHSRGCPGDGHHRPLCLSRVVANSRTHPFAVGWFCIVEYFGWTPKCGDYGVVKEVV